VNVEATELPLQAADITPPEQIFQIIDQELKDFSFLNLKNLQQV
jgi:hypothetical protein